MWKSSGSWLWPAHPLRSTTFTIPSCCHLRPTHTSLILPSMTPNAETIMISTNKRSTLPFLQLAHQQQQFQILYKNWTPFAIWRYESNKWKHLNHTVYHTRAPLVKQGLSRSIMALQCTTSLYQSSPFKRYSNELTYEANIFTARSETHWKWMGYIYSDGMYL